MTKGNARNLKNCPILGHKSRRAGKRAHTRVIGLRNKGRGKASSLCGFFASVSLLCVLRPLFHHNPENLDSVLRGKRGKVLVFGSEFIRILAGR